MNQVNNGKLDDEAAALKKLESSHLSKTAKQSPIESHTTYKKIVSTLSGESLQAISPYAWSQYC